MHYYKIIKDDYILAIGIGYNNPEITIEEYNNISMLMNNRPIPAEGYDYRLRTDLTWEEYKLPVIEADEEEINDSEALNIILGGGIQ